MLCIHNKYNSPVYVACSSCCVFTTSTTVLYMLQVPHAVYSQQVQQSCICYRFLMLCIHNKYNSPVYVAGSSCCVFTTSTTVLYMLQVPHAVYSQQVQQSCICCRFLMLCIHNKYNSPVYVTGSSCCVFTTSTTVLYMLQVPHAVYSQQVQQSEAAWT